MIQVKRNPNTSLKTIQSQKFKRLIVELLKDKNDHNFTKNYEMINTLRGDLKKDFQNKCGYCETQNNNPGFMQTDHFRPKKGDGAHPGYYWLGYEWTNYVLACPHCNKAKSSHFPIHPVHGVRVTDAPLINGQLDMDACRIDSAIHLAEHPLLLHPVLDRPEDHLEFLEDGTIRGLSLKGETTIKICNLNHGLLVYNRHYLYGTFYNDLIEVLNDFWNKQITQETLAYSLDKLFKNIKQAQESHRQFSRLGWFLLEKFELFFVSRLKRELGEKLARVTEKAFRKFKEQGTCRKKKVKESF